MRQTMRLGLIGAITAVVVDQASKSIVIANANVLSPSLPVLPGFNLVYHRNDGVAFGLLNGVPWWGLVVLASIVCIWLIFSMVKTKDWNEAVAFGLVLGGALGNVLDRIRVGAVTDFLDFYVWDLHWPAFNLADTAIFCGVALLLTWPASKRNRTEQ
ncbi:MAG: signal peptidase II [Pseudomonadota bacterium]